MPTALSATQDMYWHSLRIKFLTDFETNWRHCSSASHAARWRQIPEDHVQARVPVEEQPHVGPTRRGGVQTGPSVGTARCVNVSTCRPHCLPHRTCTGTRSELSFLQ